MSLDVYISDDCLTCDNTRNLVAQLYIKYPALKINLFNLSKPDTICPDSVFATPTYMLNGQILFLGNPSLAELENHLAPDKVFPPDEQD